MTAKTDGTADAKPTRAESPNPIRNNIESTGMSEAADKKFQQLVRALGRLIRAEANAALDVNPNKPKPKPRTATAPWVAAFIDARWFSDAEGFISKMRVVLPTGEQDGSMRVTRDMKSCLEKIWKGRKARSFAAWYGLKVTVSFDGVVTTELDDDPDCVVDPTWFHS